MKSNFVLIALVAILFVFAAGCEKKKPEQNEAPPAAPGNGSDQPKQKPPPEPEKDPEDNGGTDTETNSNVEIPDTTLPTEIVETPEELKIKSKPTLNNNLDGLQLYKQAPICGNVYRLYLVKLYDDKTTELFEMLDAASREKISQDLEGMRHTFENEEAYAAMLEYFEKKRKIHKARKEYDVVAKLDNYLRMYKKVKEAYTKEMTAAEYYAIIAAFHGKNDVRVLERFLNPARQPTVTETLAPDGEACELVMDGRSGGRKTKRIIRFALEDGEWKIADPFEKY